FVVDWAAGRDKPLRVSVTEGTVAVRGPAFGGTRFVSAHQMVEVASQDAAQPKSPSAVDDAQAPVSVDSLSPEAEVAQDETSPTARHPHSAAAGGALEASGKYAEAVKAAERPGLSSIYQAGPADDLLALARASRFAGRMDVAHQALTACRARFAGSPQ